MKKIINIFIVLIFAFSFISCKQERYEQLSQKELDKKLSKAIYDEKNWDKVDAIMPFIADKPEIFQIIDDNDIEKLKEKINQTDNFWEELNDTYYLKMQYDDCSGEKVIPHMSPLAYAVEQNKIEMVKFLLSQKVNDAGYYAEGYRANDWKASIIKDPLFIAVSNRNKEIAKLLIEYGVDIENGYFSYNDCAEYDYSIATLAEAAKWGDKEILSLLLKDRNQRSLLNGEEMSVLLNLAKDEETKQFLTKANKKLKLVNLENAEEAKKLIAEGADVNEKAWNGDTPLHYYADYDFEEIFPVLISNGANVNVKNNKGKTPLHIVDDKEQAQLLLSKGANVNAKDIYGRTPLHYMNDDETVELLISNGAEVNAKDKEGQTPLHIAAENADSSLIKILLDYGADINAKDNEDLTPLYYAIDNWNEKDGVYQDETIEFLISKGADVNVQDKEGRTLLHIATEGTASSVVDLLISKGVDVNAKDKRGETPLDYAIRKQKKFEENYDMLSRLIDPMYGRIKYIKKHLIEVGAKSGKDLK